MPSSCVSPTFPIRFEANDRLFLKCSWSFVRFRLITNVRRFTCVLSINRSVNFWSVICGRGMLLNFKMNNGVYFSVKNIRLYTNSVAQNTDGVYRRFYHSWLTVVVDRISINLLSKHFLIRNKRHFNFYLDCLGVPVNSMLFVTSHCPSNKKCNSERILRFFFFHAITDWDP